MKASDNIPDQVLQALDCGVIVVDAASRVLFWNDWMDQHTGIAATRIVGTLLATIFEDFASTPLPEAVCDICHCELPPQIRRFSGDLLPLYKAIPTDQAVTGKRLHQLVTLMPLSGSEFPSCCLIQVVENRPEQFERLPRGASRSVTQESEIDCLEQNVSLKRELIRANITLSSISDGVIVTNADGVVESLNLVAEQLTGWKDADARGEPLERVFRLEHAEPENKCGNRWEVDLPILENVEAELVLMGAGDTRFPIELSVANIEGPDQASEGSIIVFRDISQSRKMAAQLLWNATHDPLTGLENRVEFERRLEHLINSAVRDSKQHALLYLDLDQFKIVNDTCGHVAGDELLRRLTSLLKIKVRESDTLARLGGDEFGILLEGCSLTPALRLANELRCLVSEFRFSWEGKLFSVGLSIGLVSIDKQSTDTGSLLASADTACYSAKDAGRNRVHVYDKSDSEAARRRGEMQWLPKIHRALEQDQLELFCQEIVPIDQEKGRLRHIEILLRMREPDGTLIGPGAFIPAAERYNLMPALDRWVIDHTLEYMAAQASSGNAGRYMVNINLSGASLAEQGFLEFLMESIKYYGTPTDLLCFEVTETAAIANLDDAIDFITALKAIGCNFALDDFGSGLSSFAYLKHLPVDFLKIDGAFVKDMLNDPIDHAMVEAINRVGHVMGIETVAEFVEDADILEALREAGVDYAQGYHLDKPHPLPKKTDREMCA